MTFVDGIPFYPMEILSHVVYTIIFFGLHCLIFRKQLIQEYNRENYRENVCLSKVDNMALINNDKNGISKEIEV